MGVKKGCPAAPLGARRELSRGPCPLTYRPARAYIMRDYYVVPNICACIRAMLRMMCARSPEGKLEGWPEA